MSKSTNQAPKSKTANAGANAERTAWLASLRRDLKTASPIVADYIRSKIKYGLGRNERYNKRPGGIGRK